MPTIMATQIQPTVKDSPLLDALKRGNDQLALELLQTAAINATDSHGLSAIHWACFLRRHQIIKSLLEKNCSLEQGPMPSALYEAPITHDHFIFERAKKGILPDAEPFALCIPDTLIHLAEICANLQWNKENTLEDSFWKGRDEAGVDHLLLLNLKKVPSPARAQHSFFKNPTVTPDSLITPPRKPSPN